MSKTYELSYTAERIDEMLKEVDEHTIYSDATTEEHGLMSTTDKTKLDALPTAQQIDGALNDKVDKVEGKGLSENDYTDADKAKVASALQSETDPTVPSWAKQQNKPLYDYSEISNTPDLSGFITKSVNDLTNYYLKSETYTKSEVAALIGAIQQFHYEIYQTLPSSGESNVLYLIGPTGSGSDKYEEYVYANNAFTKIGDTSIDLSGYVTTSALNTALADYTTTANLTPLLASKVDKVNNATNGNFAGLDSNGNLTDSGKKASDFATASQGAKADTAYQKPQTGIPESDLSSNVQQALQKHFKGWWPDLATLKAAHTATEGDSAYVKDASPATIWSIYVYDATATTDNYWADSGTDADTSNVQTFASGEEVHEVHIANDLNTVSTEDALILVTSKGLNTEFASIKGQEKNYVEGRYYQYSIQEVIETNSNYYLEEEYIPISNGDVVTWIYASSGTYNCAMNIYNSNKEWISMAGVANNDSGRRNITINNENAAYIRASFVLTNKENNGILVNGVWKYKAHDDAKTTFLQTKEQTFTSEEKAQARENIGAVSHSELNSAVENIEGDIADALSQIDRVYFVGANNPGKYIDVYGLIPKHKYRFIPKEQFWDMSGVTNQDGSVYFLFIDNYKGDETYSRLISVVTRADREPYYDITIPSDSAYIRIGGKATLGVKVWFEIFDVTNTEDIIGQYIPADNVVSRNTDKVPMLINSCRWHKTSNSFKDFQVAICTDMHGGRVANQNVISATNGFPYIDAYVNCGDIVGSNYAEPTVIQDFTTDFTTLEKPGFIVIGNHDVGNAYFVGVCCNHEQAYNTFIKPMVDNSVLVNGEYEAGKPYWYHDIAPYKIRLIGLYEYDNNLDLASNDYWVPVAYDSSKPTLTYNTSYNIDDIVNAGNYTEYSFKCIQAVTTPANYYTNIQLLPCYKVQRGRRVIRQDQAQWFLNTLASTPADYGVIVITHNPFSNTAESINAKFSWPSGIIGDNYTQNDMATNFIRDAIVAFANNTNFTEKVVMKGNAAYLNVLNDGTIDYAYEVSKDFTANNSGVYILGLLGGHSHKDLIWKDATEKIYQVSPNCAMADGSNAAIGDVRRTNTDGLAHDSITCVSFASGRIGLVKLGVNVTERGTFRDYEVIDTTT